MTDCRIRPVIKHRGRLRPPLFKLLANFCLEGNRRNNDQSELIERLASQQSHIPAKAVEDAVKEMLEHMASTLAQGERIEIRGFGSFSLHYRAPRTGRNPKTGDKVELEGKYVPHFKPGKELRDRANIYEG